MNLTSAAPSPSVTMDLDKVLDIVELHRAAVEKHYRQFMVSNGCDPDDGWVMVVPNGFTSGLRPRFVMESDMVDDQVVFVDWRYLKPWAP